MKFRNIFAKVIIFSVILICQGLALFGFYYSENFLKHITATYAPKLPAYVNTSYTDASGTYKRYKIPVYVKPLPSIKLEGIKRAYTNVPASQNGRYATSVPVLLYHGIIQKPDGANTVFENFRDQMFALKRAGWQTVRIEDFYAFMKGEKKLPEKSMLITFDDGRKDAYYKADPLFEVLDYQAISFIITKYSTGKNNKSNYYLSEDDLKRMKESGRWQIEAHTRDGHNFYNTDATGTKGHFYSDKLWLSDKNRLETKEEFTNRIKNDFLGAKSDLENVLKTNIIAFAFPFGDFGQDSLDFPESKDIISEIIKQTYLLSFYQVWGGNLKENYPQHGEKNFFIKRIEVKPEWNGQDLLDALARSGTKRLPYKDTFEKDNGWLRVWGASTQGKGSLIVGANNSTNGSSWVLDGAYSWENYTFYSRVDLKKGSNITLLARYQDDFNFVDCNFTKQGLRIEQRLKGKERVMVDKQLEENIFAQKNGIELGISVDKDKIECLANKKILGYTFYVSPFLANGGIGFMSWDKAVNNSEFIVKRVSVEEIK